MGLIGVPAVITDQVRALGRNVLGEFGQEVQGREDLEIPLGPGGDPVAFRVGEGPASRLLGFEDNLTGAGHFNQSREAEGAAGNVLDESLDAFVISGRQENRLIDAETGVPPGPQVLDDLRFDLALSQIKSKNSFLLDEQERRHVEEQLGVGEQLGGTARGSSLKNLSSLCNLSKPTIKVSQEAWPHLPDVRNFSKEEL